MSNNKEPAEDSVDKLLITINTSILIAFVFVFQSNIKDGLVKWMLAISISLFSISLALLIWYIYRFPIRKRYLDELREKTAVKYADRIALFLEEILNPLAELKAREKTSKQLSAAKTEEDHLAIIKSIEEDIKRLKNGKSEPVQTPSEYKATRYVIESFVLQVGHEFREDYKKAFRKPLKESHANIKFYLDRVASRTRRHIFASGAVFALFSILIRILIQ